ncbi:MAG: hypothetical protein KDD45_09475 [Bdellovibrionales bacterium]|nr:hypothetical protein [Bdellovibrionales bacterium]
MNKTQLSIVLILALVLGALFETVKMVKVDTHRNGQINEILSGLDLKPFVQRLNGRAAPLRPGYRLTQNDPMGELQKLANNQKEPGQMTFGDDSSKNKKNKKKKKKKKKDGDAKKQKDDESKEEEIAKSENNENKPHEPSDVKNESDSPYDAAGAPFIAETEEDTEKQSVNELITKWSDDLLKTPDYKLLNEFISLKQTGQIPNEVFYPVVQMLIDDSRESMRLMGVFALSSTPSQESFEMLISLEQTSPFGSSVSQNISQAKQSYTSINQLKVLQNVLYSSENMIAIKEAARLVNTAATRYLANNNTDVSEQGQTGEHPLPNSTYISAFNPFKNILRSLATTSSDTDIINEASLALASITKYIPDEAPTDGIASSNI